MILSCRSACLAVVLLGIAPPLAEASDLVLTRPARSGAASLIAYERAWDRSCQDVGATVTITGQPSHGAIRVERSSSVIPATTPRSGSTGPCAGHQIAGSEVIYQSEPGFHGRDHVSWRVVDGNGRSGNSSVTIVVR